MRHPDSKIREGSIPPLAAGLAYLVGIATARVPRVLCVRRCVNRAALPGVSPVILAAMPAPGTFHLWRIEA